MMVSRLKPDSATMVGLLSAAGVYLIYQNALPHVADVSAATPHDPDIDKSRRMAAMKSAGLLGLVFLVARDLNSYVISGGALVGINYMYTHANAINPATNKLDDSDSALSIAPGMATSDSYDLPSYADADTA